MAPSLHEAPRRPGVITLSVSAGWRWEEGGQGRRRAALQLPLTPAQTAALHL